MFARLGSWCFRRRRTVVLAWVLSIVVVGGVSSAVGGNFGEDFYPPGFESTRGIDTLEDAVRRSGCRRPGDHRVPRPRTAWTTPRCSAAMEQLFTSSPPSPPTRGSTSPPTPCSHWLSDAQRDALAATTSRPSTGLRLVSPYAPEGPLQIATTGAEAGKIAFASLEIPGDDWEGAGDVGRVIEDIAPTQAGLQVELGGGAFGEFEEPSSETLGLAFAVVILVVAFGSVLAMGLPIGVAIAGIVAGSVIVTLLSQLITMPDFAPFLGIMIGLGVGIDYALFIVTRYRENLHHGHAPRAGRRGRHRHGGAGGGLRRHHRRHLLPRHARHGRGVHPGPRRRAAVVVLMTVVASLTLLPGAARLRRRAHRGHPVAGHHRHRLRRPRAGRPRPEDPRPLAVGFPLAVLVLLAGLAVPLLKSSVPPPAQADQADPFAYRWSRLVQHHPWPAADRCVRRAARAGGAHPRPAARLLRRGQLRRRTPPPAGLRPARRRLRSRLQRTASTWPPGSTALPTRRS